jgi:predicted RNA-binding Zn ribbon-like protein
MGHIPHTIANHPCIDYLNSRWMDHRGSASVNDDLLDPGWRKWFLVRWGYELEPGAENEGLEAALAGRGALRAVLEAWAGGAPVPSQAAAEMDALVGSVQGRLTFGTELDGTAGLRFEPSRRDWRWVMSEIAASASELMASGEPRRLKSCANPSCTWLFYDESHNISRRWCDPGTCGNLVKVRAHRARRAEAG